MYKLHGTRTHMCMDHIHLEVWDRLPTLQPPCPWSMCCLDLVRYSITKHVKGQGQVSNSQGDTPAIYCFLGLQMWSLLHVSSLLQNKTN